MRLRRIYDARHCGFDLPAIVRLRGTQARRAGKSNPYRPASKVRYVHRHQAVESEGCVHRFGLRGSNRGWFIGYGQKQ